LVTWSRAVAGDTKDVKFEHATGYKAADNITDSTPTKGATTWRTGVIAGKMSASGKLERGRLGADSRVVRNINNFTLGARSQPRPLPRWSGSTECSTHQNQTTHRADQAALDVLFRTPTRRPCANR
jgi:basic membrane lipoprotein Med (substrate-binding protein (PBP1-ABC) superfamily)